MCRWKCELSLHQEGQDMHLVMGMARGGPEDLRCVMMKEFEYLDADRIICQVKFLMTTRNHGMSCRFNE